MTALLVVGYLLAVPFTLFTPGFLRMWRRRESWVFAIAQAGAALITLGYVLQGGVVGAMVNGGWLLGFGTAYVLEGRKRSRAGATSGGIIS